MFLKQSETAKINLDYLRELLLILDKFQSESLSSTSDKSSKLSRSKVIIYIYCIGPIYIFFIKKKHFAF